MTDTPKHPPSPVDPGGAEPPTPAAPSPAKPGGMAGEGDAPSAPDETERKGGMIGEG